MRLLLGCLLATLLVAAPAQANPLIFAHRGGTLERGQQVYGEATMPAFRNATRHGWIVEFDVHVTSDGVPVVIHDDSLDRVVAKSCRFRGKAIHTLTLAQVRSCPVAFGGKPIPTLAEVLALAKRARATISPEIKNIPPVEAGPSDFDPTPAFATSVATALRDSGFPQSRMIVQSFYPPNLLAAKQLLPDAHFLLLTLGALNAGAVAAAKASGADWIGPQLTGQGVGAGLVSQAHQAGIQVAPYTPDTRAELDSAVADHADGIFTDDPVRAEDELERVGTRQPTIPAAPARAACAATAAHRTLPAAVARGSARHGIRVFAIQYKQELRHVESYATFRRKMECLLQRYVVPFRSRHHPNVVVLSEDVGLMTIATGSRGATARATFAAGSAGQPNCETSGVPCGAVAALGEVGVGYARELAAYRLRFPSLNPISGMFVAATDTFARGWMQTFSDLARRYRVYIVGSNNQPPFRESTDPADIDLFADPDLPRPRSVFVATSDKVYNEAFLWGPRNVRLQGPTPLRNLMASNRKVPLTDIEELLQLTPGASTGQEAMDNLAPYRVPGTRARLGIATSLPAFQFGPASAKPCADATVTYMRCLAALGTNVVLQDEANPGRWAANAGSGTWQPEEWLGSTWRTVAEPRLGLQYNVTPMLVGNLADLPFDGQSAITQRGLRGRGCGYVGAPRKREFLALVPWVTPDAPRDQLAATGAKLAPGSGDALENDYVEAGLVADLAFPPRARRRGCVMSPAAR